MAPENTYSRTLDRNLQGRPGGHSPKADSAGASFKHTLSTTAGPAQRVWGEDDPDGHELSFAKPLSR